MINMYVQILLRLNLIILFLLLIRKLIGNKLRKKFVYGLWIVVPVFLLSFPFVRLPRFFQWEMNLGNLLQVEEKEALPQEMSVDTTGRMRSDIQEMQGMAYSNTMDLSAENEVSDPRQLGTQSQKGNLKQKGNANDTNTQLTSDKTACAPMKEMKLSTVVGVMYLIVVAILLLYIVISNVRFQISCKKKREYLRRSEGAGLSVYRLDGIVSPFLMGRTIYLPSYMVEEDQIRYAILHEESHYRHGDAFWVIVRYVVLAVYFYDPVIWLAFFVSGRDCELACDEAVLEKIGAEEGSSYGECLLGIVEQKLHKTGRMVMTTNMSTGKKFIKERIVNIMNRKKKSRITMAVAAAAMMVVTGFAYEKQNVDASKQESLTSKTEEVTEGSVFNLPTKQEEAKGASLINLPYVKSDQPDELLLNLPYVKSDKSDESLLDLEQEKIATIEDQVSKNQKEKTITEEKVSDQVERIVSGQTNENVVKLDEKTVEPPNVNQEKVVAETKTETEAETGTGTGTETPTDTEKNKLLKK